MQTIGTSNMNDETCKPVDGVEGSFGPAVLGTSGAAGGGFCGPNREKQSSSRTEGDLKD
jgi:hypothetical protein